jgi:hypothetical protein
MHGAMAYCIKKHLNVIKWSVGRLIRKWEGNIKMDPRGIDCEVGRYSEWNFLVIFSVGYGIRCCVERLVFVTRFVDRHRQNSYVFIGTGTEMSCRCSDIRGVDKMFVH